jgi:hypothetical protein
LIQHKEQVRIDALTLRLASMGPSARRQFERFSRMKIRDQVRIGVFDGEPYSEKRAKALRAGLIAWQNKFKQDGEIDEESYVREADTQSERIEGAIKLNPTFRSADVIDQTVLLASMTVLAIILEADMKRGVFPAESWNILAEPWKTCEGSALFLI